MRLAASEAMQYDAEGSGPIVLPILEALPKWSLVQEIMEVCFWCDNRPLHIKWDLHRV